MSLRLSICIPIFNCAEFIVETLESVLPQTDGAMEVIVYDGGSTDGTHTLIEPYTRQWSNLRYFQAAERGGIDADLATCVGLARGDYCWLFSGDDVMRPGAIAHAMEWLKLRRDVYICKHTLCDKRMVISQEHPVLDPDTVFMADLANPDERAEWFRRAVTTEAFFSFLSGLIVRRGKWLEGTLPEQFRRSCWGHVARYFGLIPSGLLVCYVGEVWLDQRGGNDSFADRGVVNRFRIGIEGYNQLADHFFGSSSADARYIRKAILNEFPLIALLGAKSLCSRHPDREDRVVLDRIVRMLYSDASISVLARRAAYFALPHWSMKWISSSYRSVKRVLRALRR